MTGLVRVHTNLCNVLSVSHKPVPLFPQAAPFQQNLSVLRTSHLLPGLHYFHSKVDPHFYCKQKSGAQDHHAAADGKKEGHSRGHQRVAVRSPALPRGASRVRWGAVRRAAAAFRHPSALLSWTCFPRGPLPVEIGHRVTGFGDSLMETYLGFTWQLECFRLSFNSLRAQAGQADTWVPGGRGVCLELCSELEPQRGRLEPRGVVAAGGVPAGPPGGVGTERPAVRAGVPSCVPGTRPPLGPVSTSGGRVQWLIQSLLSSREVL